MVLPLKRWKSRSSPGFAAGVRGIEKEPIHIVIPGLDPGAEGSARPNGRPDPAKPGRKAKPADAGAGA